MKKTTIQVAIEAMNVDISVSKLVINQYKLAGRDTDGPEKLLYYQECKLADLQSLLPAERETIEQAYLQGAKHPEYSESTHATEYYFDTFTASGDKSKEK